MKSTQRTTAKHLTNSIKCTESLHSRSSVFTTFSLFQCEISLLPVKPVLHINVSSVNLCALHCARSQWRWVSSSKFQPASQLAHQSLDMCKCYKHYTNSTPASTIMNCTSWPWWTMLTARLSFAFDDNKVGPKTIAKFWGNIRLSLLCWITLYKQSYLVLNITKSENKYHGQRGSTSPVLTATGVVKGKWQNSTPSTDPCPLTGHQKISHMWLRRRPYRCQI